MVKRMKPQPAYSRVEQQDAKNVGEQFGADDMSCPPDQLILAGGLGRGDANQVQRGQFSHLPPRGFKQPGAVDGDRSLLVEAFQQSLVIRAKCAARSES
jgi:hypothetical protein